jgi:hypothetical protein
MKLKEKLSKDFVRQGSPETQRLGSQHLEESNSQHLTGSSQQTQTEEILLTPNSPAWVEAKALTSEVHKSGKAPKTKVQSLILAITRLGFITLREMANYKAFH